MDLSSRHSRASRPPLPVLDRRGRKTSRGRGPRAYSPEVSALEGRTLLTVTPLLGLPGMNINDGGPYEPPDTSAATGPGQVVELVNTAMTVIDKTSGARLSTQNLASFFPVQSGDSLTDPFVTYDDTANRFFVGIVEYNQSTQKSYYDFAISDGPDASAGFTEKHQVDVSESANGEGLLADFPRVGWDHDAYVISFNEFGFSSNSFANVQVLSIDKGSVIDQDNSTLVDYRLDRDASNYTMVPAVMHGAAAGAPIWFVEEGTAANTLRFVSMSTVPGSTPTFTDYAQMPVAAYGQPPDAAQPGGGTIATNDTRVLSVAWRNNAMVAAQTVGTGGLAHARWYDLSTASASPTLSQYGEIAPGAGVSTYYPAIEIAADGDLGMTYMESSATQYMSVYVTGRTASDPTGTMETPVLAHAGTAHYSGSRAGDYSGISVDPNPGLQSFWAASEYSPGSPYWGTWIQNFSLGGNWSSYNHDPQHTGLAQVAAQPIQSLHWSTPVDLAPQFSGSDLLIHYGSPVVTPANTVIIPVKTGTSGGFQLQARSGNSGALKWVQSTDYALPPSGTNWTPSYSPTLTSAGKLYFPGLGGTVYRIDSPDSGVGTVTQLAFYGTYTHAADSTVFINTPITADTAGDVYFGFQTFGAAPGGLTSGIARIDANGNGTWAAAPTIAGNGSIVQVVDNAAPALSNDGQALYVPVSTGNDGSGYLVALDSTTLAVKSRVALADPSSGQLALLPNDGSASPTVGPDGDVYFGVLENPFPGHHDRGWLLHYSGDLATVKTPGSFGWDDTASIVPARLVPSYKGTSTYLVMTKYNDYAGDGGTGVNKLAILDPNAQQADLVFPGTPVMKEVLTIAGVTPDPEFPNNPGAVREWCINAAAVDPVTKSVIVNSEDGRLYRWDLSTNTFTQSLTLEPATGEAYTSTFIGPDGTVYAINDAVLHAVGKSRLAVNTFVPTPSGFKASFTEALNPATLNLYTTAAVDLGPADVTVVGASTGPVYGSLIVDPSSQTITFVQTGGVLAPDTYTVDFRSSANGFVATNGDLLDGNNDGTPGDDYTTTFTVAPSSSRVISIPDFARGPGQPVNVPATAGGLPLSIGDGTGVTSIRLTLTYNPALLTITGASPGPDAPAGASVSVDTSTPGSAVLTFSSPTALPAGPGTFATLTASVPASAPYKSKEALVLGGLSVNGGAIAATGDTAVHVAAYVGDSAGLGYYNSQDVTLIRRVLVGIDTGFAAFPLLDPTIAADITNTGSLSSQDAALLRLYLTGGNVPLIPDVPDLTLVPGGPDPLVWVPRTLAGAAGTSLTVPILLRQTNGTAIGLDAASLAIEVDPALFVVNGVRPGGLMQGFSMTESVDEATGLIVVRARSAVGPLTLEPGVEGTLLLIDLSIRPGASSGAAPINLLGDVRLGSRVFSTSLNDGQLTLNPAPTDSDLDPVDGLVTIARPPAPASLVPGPEPVSGSPALVDHAIESIRDPTGPAGRRVLADPREIAATDPSSLAIAIPATPPEPSVITEGLLGASRKKTREAVVVGVTPSVPGGPLSR